MNRIESLRNYRPDKLPFGKDTGTSRIRRPYIDVGEFLPVSIEEELEFARISLASTTGDVNSLRIRREDDLFMVTIVDEYETVFEEYQNEYDQIPTQGEVFDIITDMCCDFQPYCLDIIERNELETIDQIMAFIQIDSYIYPDLNELFEDYLTQRGYRK